MRLLSNKSFFLSLVLLLFSLGCKRAIQSEARGSNQSEVQEHIERVIPQNKELNSSNLPKTRFNTSSQGISIVSWNIQYLGRTKTPEDILEIANIVRDFDIVAIQEVVAINPSGAQAVAKIADELNRMGFKWDYQISDPTKSPSSNISERYAFFWKTSRVSLIHRAYLDKELEDICYREPYIAAFKAKGKSKTFYVVNYHSRTYKDKPEEEIIHFIDYPKRLDSDRIIIAGDFNLTERHDVWRPLYRNGFRNALSNQRTTLRRKCKNGDYLSRAIDNIYFLPGIKMLQARSLDFVQNCDNLKRAQEISDHLPVYMEFKIEAENDI